MSVQGYVLGCKYKPIYFPCVECVVSKNPYYYSNFHARKNYAMTDSVERTTGMDKNAF